MSALNDRAIVPPKKRASFVPRGVVARSEDHADERPTVAVYVEEERRKKITARAEGGTYLVLRACRACNHRGTAKRPSTPSHSASRHSIFFSPRPDSVPSAGHFPSGALRPPYCASSPFTEASYLCFSSSVPVHHDECAHSIIIIGSRSRTGCTAHLFPAFLLSTVVSQSRQTLSKRTTNGQ